MIYFSFYYNYVAYKNFHTKSLHVHFIDISALVPRQMSQFATRHDGTELAVVTQNGVVGCRTMLGAENGPVGHCDNAVLRSAALQ